MAKRSHLGERGRRGGRQLVRGLCARWSTSDCRCATSRLDGESLRLLRAPRYMISTRGTWSPPSVTDELFVSLRRAFGGTRRLARDFKGQYYKVRRKALPRHVQPFSRDLVVFPETFMLRLNKVVEQLSRCELHARGGGVTALRTFPRLPADRRTETSATPPASAWPRAGPLVASWEGGRVPVAKARVENDANAVRLVSRCSQPAPCGALAAWGRRPARLFVCLHSTDARTRSHARRERERAAAPYKRKETLCTRGRVPGRRNYGRRGAR